MIEEEENKNEVILGTYHNDKLLFFWGGQRA